MVAHPSWNNTAYELTDQMSDDQFEPGYTAGALGGTGAPVSPRMDYLLGDFLAAEALAGPSTPVIPSISSVNHPSCEGEGIGGLWFGLIHVTPREIALGNILGTVQVTIDIFNADFSSHDYGAWTNNAGAGISLNNPALPTTIPSMNGLVLTLTVTPDGPPSVDSTLVYDFDASTIIVVQPISLTRLVPIVFAPERKIREELAWLTDVQRAVDGTEKRVALRKNPRQLYDLGFLRENNVERQRLENLLFDWQARLFGLPVWTDAMYLSAAVGIGDSTINVDDTSYSDLRDSGLAIIWTDETDYEILNVDVVGASSFTRVPDAGGLRGVPAADPALPRRGDQLPHSVHRDGQRREPRGRLGLQRLQRQGAAGRPQLRPRDGTRILRPAGARVRWRDRHPFPDQPMGRLSPGLRQEVPTPESAGHVADPAIAARASGATGVVLPAYLRGGVYPGLGPRSGGDDGGRSECGVQ
jgi:hypothetical protein